MPRPTAVTSLLAVLIVLALGVVVSLLLVLSGVLSPYWHMPEPVALKVNDAPRPVRALGEKMRQPISLPQGIGPSTSLAAALEFLGDRYDFHWTIDQSAFARAGIVHPEHQAVQLPKMVGVSLATVLRLLLGQLKGGTCYGKYRLRDDGIEITTTEELNIAEAHWEKGEFSPVPKVDVEFDGQSLYDALEEIRWRTGINLDIDEEVVTPAARGQRVEVRFHRMPVETALRLLVDKAKLEPLLVGNSWFVTTAERAQVLAIPAPMRRSLPKVDRR